MTPIYYMYNKYRLSLILENWHMTISNCFMRCSTLCKLSPWINFFTNHFLNLFVTNSVTRVPLKDHIQNLGIYLCDTLTFVNIFFFPFICYSFTCLFWLFTVYLCLVFCVVIWWYMCYVFILGLSCTCAFRDIPGQICVPVI